MVSLRSMLLALVCVVFAFGQSWAQDEEGDDAMAQPEQKTVVGTVSATMDAAGEITDVTICDESGTVHKLVLDDKAKELGKTLNGKKVEVKGTAGDSGLTVSEFKEVSTAAPAVKPKAGKDKAKAKAKGGKDKAKAKGGKDKAKGAKKADKKAGH